MSPVSKALDASLSKAVLLNARRYGLSQENLTQFSELMNTLRGQKPDAGEDTAQDAPQVSYSDLIKDYVKQRMTERMRTSMQDQRSQGTYAPDAQFNPQANPQDFLLNAMNAPRQSSNDISNLLNMHFDLNTLQMLP